MELKTKIEKISPREIKGGDTIMRNGVMMTVSGKFIKQCNFYDTTTIHGISIRNNETVERVLFPILYKSQVIRYSASK